MSEAATSLLVNALMLLRRAGVPMSEIRTAIDAFEEQEKKRIN